MQRDSYKLFSEGRIGGLSVPNRLLRSATWDPCLFADKQMTAEVLAIYRGLTEGGVGTIVTGSFPVGDTRKFAGGGGGYADSAIAGVDTLANTIHQSGNGCKAIAQLDIDGGKTDPSETASPYSPEKSRAFETPEIEVIETAFVDGIIAMQAAGFDGIQLHAAHGTVLSRFLSPFSNRRTDAYGGSPEQRVEIVRRIVRGARRTVGDYPILIKVNSTDHLEDGMDIHNFPPTAAALEDCGLDAIEVSGGMWECLVRSEAELGFRPVPSPEGHTRLNYPERQTYYLPYAEAIDVSIPIILVGGNRDVERLEVILQRSKVDFIALCRPLICEPDLPRRWRAGSGRSDSECISCNACLYEMLVHPGRDTPPPVRCVYKNDHDLYHASQKWLANWVKEATRKQDQRTKY